MGAAMPPSPGEMKTQLEIEIKKEAEKIINFDISDRDLVNNLEAKIDEISAHITSMDSARSEKKEARGDYISERKAAERRLEEDRKSGAITEENYRKEKFKIKAMKHAEHAINFSELSVRKLLGFIKPLLSGDVGSYSLTLKLGVSVGARGGAKAGLNVTYHQNLWIEDDRKIRSSTGVGANAFGEVGLAGLIGGGADASLGYGRTKVFASPEQWAAYTSQKCIRSGLNMVRRKKQLAVYNAAKADLIDNSYQGRKENKKNFSQLLPLLGINSENYEEIENLSKQSVTKVNVYKGKLGAKFDAPVAGVSLNASEKILDFRKKDKVNGIKNRRTAGVVSVGGSFKLGGLLDVQVAYTRIKNHANPDNDGTYLNLKFVSGVSLKGGIKGESAEKLCNQGWLEAAQNFEEQLVDAGHVLDHGTPENPIPAGDREIMNEAIDKVKKAFGFNHLEKIFEDIPVNLSGNIQAGSSTGLELNFVLGMRNSGGWRLQYRRTFHDFNASAEGSVAAGGPINVDFGMGISKGGGTDRSLGTSTLTYLLTVYNGLTKRQKSRDSARSDRAPKSPDEWLNFAHAHKSDIITIFQNIGQGDDNSKLTKEIQSDHAGKTEHKLYHILDMAFQDLKEDCSNTEKPAEDANFNRLVERLNLYFYYLSFINDQEANAGWKKARFQK